MDVMRFVFVLLLLFATAPALAEDWGSYANPRFGYAVAVPPGFAGEGEAANGDGQRFRSRDGTQQLEVWGGHVMEASFEQAITAAMRATRDGGWMLSYERATPSWASWSGSRNGMIGYTRMIALCGGARYAAFRLVYPRRDLSRMDAVVDRLVGTLKANDDC